jgi:cation:H+ antiporter
MMLLALVLFLGSAIAIYVSCEYFVNGVEWVGQRLNVSQTATGTILAAFGTALPESVVTFVAVVFGHTDAERQIGVGAALGGPLVLSTLAYGVVGLALLATAGRRQASADRVDADCRALSRDQRWFLGIFVVKLTLGVLVFAGKPWFGIAFLLAYAVYVWKELRGSGDTGEAEELEPLRLRPRDALPHAGWALLQTGLATVAIFFASRIFVDQLGVIGPFFGLPPQLVALLLSPVATEMPETMNAIIWVRQGKERLALSNISGAMMIQATIPTATGIFGTPWLFDRPLVIAGIVTTLAVAFLFATFRTGIVTGRRLSLAALFYPVFVAALLLLR